MAGARTGSRPDETALLVAARDGDGRAFGSLYRRYLPDIRDYCRRRVKDVGRAEDLAQDTFVRAFQRMSAFRIGTDFWPWLQVIARNLCIDEGRSSRHRREVPDAAPEFRCHDASTTDLTSETVVAKVQRQRSRSALTSAFTHLDQSQRLLLWQHDVEEMTYEEIARARGTTIAAVRNSAWRARTILRSTIGDSGRRLRSWILIPVPALAHMKRWLGRQRLTLQLAFRQDAVAALIERSAALAFSMALLGSPWTIAPIDRRTTRGDAASHLQLPRTVEHHRSLGGGGDSFQPRPAIDRDREMISADFGTHAPNEGGAGPSRVVYRIEIRAPDGEVLYWEETDIECGPGRPFEDAPRHGPVRAYC